MQEKDQPMKQRKSALVAVADYLGRILSLASFVALMCLSACVKCPIATLVIEGDVTDAMDIHDSVVVTVTPDANAKQIPPQIKDRHFVARVRFNTLRSAGRWYHNCSRKPETIVISLVRDGTTLDQVKLNFTKDFVKESDVTYRIVRPVFLGKKK